LKLQAAGKLPAAQSHAQLEREIQNIETHKRPHFNIRKNAAAVVIWASNNDYSYLVGQNKIGKKTVSYIDTESNGCYYPTSIKIDASQNIWNGCEYNSDFEGGEVQEYSKTGSLLNSWTMGCPQPTSECDSWYSYGYDQGTDGTHAFAVVEYSEEYVCTTEYDCSYVYGSGFEWWSSTSSPPNYINLGDSCSPVCEVYYMDVDSSGNLWFTYYGYNGSEYGTGLGEITNPTTSPSMKTIEPVGTYECPGGVYIGGSTISVADGCSRYIYQYTLPLGTNGSPSNTSGPTLPNAFGYGEPLTGGFNSTGTKAIYGDSYGWLDRGNITADHWSDVTSTSFSGYVPGAAYTPSNK